jgi:hypothetical protein
MVVFTMKNAFVKVLIPFVLMAALGAAQTVNAGEPGPSLSHLTKFIGKMPSYNLDKKGNRAKGPNLLNDKAFQQVLLKTLGKERFNTFMGDDMLEDKIEKQGQVIYFQRSMRQTAIPFGMIFINLSDNSIEAYWEDGSWPDKNKAKYYWLSSKTKPRILPTEPKEGGFDLFKKYGNKGS